MKQIVLISIGFLIAGAAVGQDFKLKMDSLQALLVGLEQEKKSLEKKTADVKNEINRLAEISKYEDGRLKVKSTAGGYILNQPSMNGDVVAQVPKDGYVYVYPGYLKDDYLKVKFGDYDGYIYKVVLEQTADLKTLLKNAETFSKNQKYKELVKKYGERDGYRIHTKSYWIGMKKEMLIEMLGSPINTNRTNFRNAIQEQLIYEKYDKRIYFYFDDGILTSYQD